MRKIAAAVAATATAVTATVLFAAAPAFADHDRCAPSRNSAALRASIADLGTEASGALIRFSDGATCFRGTSGVVRIGSHQQIPDDARFRIGSMTKSFTTAAVLQLAAQGKVDLNETTQHYLPGYLPASYPPITVRQLLNYTNGLQGVPMPNKTPEWFLAHRYDTWAPGSQIDRTVPLAFAPGTRQKYGNEGHLVAGLIIEKVTGRPYGQAIRDGILRPLRLRDTYLPGTERQIRGPHAHGYELMDGKYVDITDANPTLQWSAAEMISTAADLDTFMTALVGGKLLPAAQQAELFAVPNVPDHTTGQPATYGAGLSRIDLGHGLVLWGKSGDRPGYNGGVAVTPDLTKHLVYSINTLHMGSERPELAIRIVAAALA